MWLRRISVIAGLLILVGGVAVKNMLAAQKKAPELKVEAPSPRLVKTLEVANGDVQVSIEVSGRTLSRQKISVFSEVPGKLIQGSRRFREGVSFSKGEVLFRVDDTDAALTLQSQRSSFRSLLLRILPDIKFDYPDAFGDWERYSLALEAGSALPEIPGVSDDRLRSYLSVNGVYDSYYAIRSAEERLLKYTVRAPFSGVVSSGDLTPGVLVSPNQPLGQFIDPVNYDLEASVLLADLDWVKPGQEVEMYSDELDRSWEGRVQRIGKMVDPATQTVPVFVQVSGSGLREGMYLNGTIGGKSVADATAVPRERLNPDGTIWTVNGGALQASPVEVIHAYGDLVVISGLSNGSRMVDQDLPGAYTGMIVSVEAKQ